MADRLVLEGVTHNGINRPPILLGKMRIRKISLVIYHGEHLSSRLLARKLHSCYFGVAILTSLSLLHAITASFHEVRDHRRHHRDEFDHEHKELKHKHKGRRTSRDSSEDRNSAGYAPNGHHTVPTTGNATNGHGTNGGIAHGTNGY